jgi:pyruvate/2-oxoglutarate dehydrogenase complex dihydrolipoamide acyltransferase (E2) component
MVAKDAKAAGNLKQGTTTDAEVTLTDGRTLKVDATVTDPRPGVELLGKSVQTSASSNDSNIQLANEDELPQDAKLRFSVRAKSPKAFTRAEHIEVATQDGVFTAKLSLDNGGMTLQDSQIALVTLDPAKAFGGSAFGPLKFRVVANGLGGDWQPLATLVRLPTLQTLKCPSAPDQQCRLSGSNLFLVDSVSSDPQFSNPVQVPDGFPGYVLPVPHSSGALYLKLRDDPSIVNQVTLAAETLPPPPGEAASQHAAPRPPYHAGEPAPAPGAATAAPGASNSATPAPPAGDQKAAPPATQPSPAPATGQSQDKTPPPPAKPANPQPQSSQTTAPKPAPSPAPEAAKPAQGNQQATSQQP